MGAVSERDVVGKEKDSQTGRSSRAVRKQRIEHARNGPFANLCLAQLHPLRLPPPLGAPFVYVTAAENVSLGVKVRYGLPLSSALFCSNPASRSPTICSSPYSATRNPLGFSSERAVSTRRTLYRPTILSVASAWFFTR